MISVDPGATELSQKVQDVFIHVLDLFDLLAHSGETADDAIAWRLVSVSMNSPLTVVAEAIAARPAPPFNVDEVARVQKRRFASHVSELKSGRVPNAWRGARELKRMARAFNRAQPGTTRIEVEQAITADALPEVVEVKPSDLTVVEQAIAAATTEAMPKSKDQVGSVEGQLLEVGTFYGKPAIKLRERKSGLEMWCTVTEAHREEVASTTNFDDVWAGRRVLVEGTLAYDKTGLLSRVSADTVHVVRPVSIPPDSLHDPAITSGMSAAEYLERFREGTLG